MQTPFVPVSPNPSKLSSLICWWFDVKVQDILKDWSVLFHSTHFIRGGAAGALALVSFPFSVISEARPRE